MMGALALQLASAISADAIGALFLGTGITKMLDQPGFARSSRPIVSCLSMRLFPQHGF